MKRAILILCVLAACGDDGEGGPLIYKNPPKGGKLRLVKAKKATGNAMLLDFVVGDSDLTGYSTGFDLPLDVNKVVLGDFTPGTVLDPGSTPVAANAKIATDGPLNGMLVAAQTQKASGTGAIATDTTLPAGSILFTLQFLPAGTDAGMVFDGQATGFLLPSGGLRDRVGMMVVDPADVSIGTLTLKR